MLEILNRYSHGLACIPIFHALRERGCLVRMAETPSVSAEQLAQEFSANRGYLDAALRMLVCLDWVRPAAHGRYEAMPGLASLSVIPDRIMDLYNFPFDPYVRGEAEESLEPWLEISERLWNSEHPYLPDYLDGLLIIPLLLSLRAHAQLGVAEQDSETSVARLNLNVSLPVRRSVERLFIAKGWGSRVDDALQLNQAGRFIVNRIFITATVASYRPMFGRAQELLFGNPARVFARDPQGHETHVDRTVNVIGSGFQHEKYFVALSDLVVRCFDNESFSSQPKYIADMGCGDGSLLRRLYETVRDRTRRGKVLDAHPVILVAADFNEKALAEASRTLAGIQHIAIKGDIGNPAALLETLRANGVEDVDRILHVRSFLDHNRPYLPPEDRKAAERRSQSNSAGIYVDAQGSLIPPGDMVQSTVEHLCRWSEIVNPHGLVMLEVHCLPPDVTGRYLDESESFHFDAYHAMSHQYLLDAQAFLACAAEAGLFCREAVSFPKNLPFTRISLNHFERRPYRVRCVHDQDFSAVADLDEIWAQPQPQSDAEQSVAALRPRPFDFSEQEFMLEAQGRVLASVHYKHKEQVQITSAYLRHDVPANYLRDLLQFVEQYWALAGVAHIGGIEDCRYALSSSNDNISMPSAVAHDLMAFVSRYPFAATDDPRMAERELGMFSFRWLLAILQRMGVMRHAGESYDLGELEQRIGVSPKYHRYFEALMRRLEDEGLLKLDGHRLETTALVPDYALLSIEEQVAEFKQEFQRRYPGTIALMNLTVCCLARFEEIITGRVDITDVLFQNASMDVFADIFCGHAASNFFNQIIADAVHDAVFRLKPTIPKIRILEIGAGTGGTTAVVLETLKPFFNFVEFWFTDISLAFIRNARRRFSERYPSVEYRLLNIEVDLSEQGFAAHSFDIIVAANVLHDTRDVEFALKQVRRLLKPNGLLVLDEYTSIKDCLFFSGALLHGYWLFQDPERRLKDSCLLGVSQWRRALEQTGFAIAGLHALPTQNLDSSCSQSVMLCEALQDGTGTSEAAGQNANIGKSGIVGAFVKQQVVALLGEKRAPVYSAQRPFMDMGLDSIEMVELKFLLEQHFGIKLSPMFLFQYETPEKMAAALSEMVPDEQFRSMVPIQQGEVTGGGNQAATDETTKLLVDEGESPDAIAIVGIACRFPGGSVSPQSFWKLLESGRHGIVSMPDARWKWPGFINLQGEHKGIDKAGFLDRIDEFDAPFFRTSPKEAKLMDPQQRLLLELSWEAMEDGGHRPSELRGRKIGVFVGVCHGDYRELLTIASETESEAAYVGTGSAYSLLANRLSYFYDFKGPSMTVDTACSSSLFALHDAVTAIRQGDCEQALVGAANLLCSPTNSIAYYRAGMLSPTGRCRTFDETADGYVRGEGAAMLLLKPLDMAIGDGDPIYGLIKGTAVNHGGQAASLTAPKPEAQAAVIEAAWRAAHVAVESVGYIETHGTGTKLGDPIEIGGLTEAFRRLYETPGNNAPVKPHCGLGSVKTNIGHLEGAAGLAGVIKILMAMRHGSIPPTLNFEQLNSHISLADTPFYIVPRTQPWARPGDERGRELPRRAGVSSFGFGGANAHAVIEEYPRSNEARESHPGRCLVPLSARDNNRLLEQARRLQEFLASGFGNGPFAEISLVRLAYTLQVGREPMQERIAFLVQSMEELLAALQALVAGDTTIPNSYRSHSGLQGHIAGTSAMEYERDDIETAIAARDLTKLASLWVKGAEVDWSKLYDEVKPRRISLPTYPFARERYWIEIDLDKGATAEFLHPLLHRNTSDLREQRYTSTFTGEEFFFIDHQARKDSVNAQKLLPAVACLEMARAAIEEGVPEREQGTVLELRHTVWGQPIIVQETEKKEVSIALWAKGEKEIEYEIYSESAEQETVHCQGIGVSVDAALPARLDVEQLLRQMQDKVEPEQVYEACAQQGLHYGIRMQSVRALRRGKDQLLVQLQLPEDVGKAFGDYALHPSLMDGVLQACIGLLQGPGEREARAPFNLEQLRVVAPCSREMWAWVRYAPGNGGRDRMAKLDLDLCNRQGNISVQMRGLSCHLASPEVVEPILYIEASPAVPVAPMGASEIVSAVTSREIAFLSENRSALAPAQRKKPGGISLESPTLLSSAASAGNTTGQASAGQSLIMLSNATLDLTALSSTGPVSPFVRLYDHGQGVFSISHEVPSSCRAPAKDIMIQFLQALDKVKQEPTVKVLKIRGLEYCFPRGDREEYNQAVEQGLYQSIVSFPYPVISVLQNNVIGAGFLAAALCDFIVCSEDATYAYTDIEARIYPTAPEAILLSERFGACPAQDLLYISPACTGRQLRSKGWTCPVVPATQVEACAEQLASSLALKPRQALRLLKQHLSCHIVGLVKDLVLVEIVASSAEDCFYAAEKEIVSATEHIQLEASAEHVLVAKFCAGNHKPSLKELFTELCAILTQVAQCFYYKAVVLASDELDFFGGAEHSAAENVISDVQYLLGQMEIPVVAALAGNAKGLGWIISQLCNACVYSETGIYSVAGIGKDATVRQMAAALLSYRMGSDVGKEILLTVNEYSGVDLRQRVSSLMVAGPDQVLPLALQVAGFWASLPRTTLVAWTKHTSTAIQQKFDSLQTAVNREEQDETPNLLPASPKSIPLPSRVVTAMAHPEGIVVVKMEDQEAKNMFSDAFVQGVQEAFAHIEEVPAYKVVVLTGYDTYFSSGGTKENLLAIQEGKSRFTDIGILQAALDCKLPVIAAMQGHGIGAGWTLGMFADLVLLSEESRYISPYMNYGFTPGAGATWILGDKMGQDLARESLLTGQYYSGKELKDRGLKMRILPRAEIHAAALVLARQIARNSRRHLMDLKQQLNEDLRKHLRETYQLELAMHEKTFIGQSGTLEEIQKSFYQERDASSISPQADLQPAIPSVEADLLLPIAAHIKTLLANELQMREGDISENVQFVEMGLDSISGVTWVRKINEKYHTRIEATKVYVYPTLEQFSRYVKEEAARQGTLPSPAASPVLEMSVKSENGRSSQVEPVVEKLISRRSRAAARFATANTSGTSAAGSQSIAVIGMAGQFPQAKNLEEFWQNLAQGRNCIAPVPRERWDVNAYYQADSIVAGKTNSQWAGALEEYDRFDPLFFNISPTEAENMDPQQRLFLQACWHAIEDAAYDARALSGSKCGVFVGCANGDYHLLSREHQLSAQGFTGSEASILGARISYFLNLQGPCISIDTACSSALVALAHACDSLVSGSSDLALAGGVYVMTGPEMHIKTAQAGMLSPEGRCYSFDQRANGFVPGEGVGVVLLKRLEDAERDGDIITGVIEGWGVNQDGKTNGITAPNPESQARLEQEVYEKYRIDPGQIQLVEAHGTGTKLGDPIEVEGLKKAFGKYTEKREYCALGSVKSNIGHALWAAGIAGALKVMLALKHRELPPTINFEGLNEHIELKRSPFYVSRGLKEWEVGGGERRHGAVSSFGFSGTNAHVVIGEYVPKGKNKGVVGMAGPTTKAMVPLSARTAEQLKQKADDLRRFIGKKEGSRAIELKELAYTLQVGREGMEERVGFVVETLEQLEEKLAAYVEGKGESRDIYQGEVGRNKESMSVISQDDEIKETLIDKWIAARKFSKLLGLWVKGLELDWNKLYGAEKPQRINLPVYPFAKERYWIHLAASPLSSASMQVSSGVGAAVLHPLLHCNTSDLSQQCYSSIFAGDEFFFAEHLVRDARGVHKILPGVAFLEMTRAAIEKAWPMRPQGAVLELRNTIWAQPLMFAGNEKKQVTIILRPNDEEIDYEIHSHDGELIHCQGRAAWSQETPARLDLKQLIKEMTEGDIDPAQVYTSLAAIGILHGPSFQTIAAVHHGTHQLLSRLRLPRSMESTSTEYVLHPSLMDGALQGHVGLINGWSGSSSQTRLPFALESMRIFSPCTPEGVAWVRQVPGSRITDNVVKFDVSLCDEHGNICVEIKGFSSRLVGQDLNTATAHAHLFESLIAAPVWQASEMKIPADAEYGSHHLIICELPQVNVEQLRAVLRQSHCLSLQCTPGEKNIAQRYSEYALMCLERIQKILQSKPQGKILVQIVVAEEGEHALLAGLSGLLKTAGLENPQLTGQLILVPGGITVEELVRNVQAEKCGAGDSLVRYEAGVRKVLRWEEVKEERQPEAVWRDQGVYLITGGLGRLGLLFAKEILEQTSAARLILTGRSVLIPEKQSRLDELSAQAGRVSYRQLDLNDVDQVRQLISAIQKEYGQLNGILHSAGMIQDNFLLKKGRDQFSQVLEPKVMGTYNLDEASRGVELDFLMLFSSVAAVLGNIGQADYVAANGFMDQFAGYRNRQVAMGERYGRTRSINWGLWESGGMSMDTATQELVEQRTGVRPMPTTTGLKAFYHSLALPYDQLLVAEGDREQIGRAVFAGLQESEPQSQVRVTTEIDSESLTERTQHYLRRQFSGLLKVPSHKIDPNVVLEKYGIDSILAMQLTNELEKTFGSLSKTLFFEYQTIHGLTQYFVSHFEPQLRALFARSESRSSEATPMAAASSSPFPANPNQGRRFSSVRKAIPVPITEPAAPTISEPIAMIGLSGRYPKAADLDAYWHNLREGKDCITEVPKDRWDWRKYYSKERGQSGHLYCKWGGFIAGIDEFDPLFFNISPLEAEIIDPQERLFLQHAWMAVEDAGYTRASLQVPYTQDLPGQVGVYAGVWYSEYQLLGVEANASGRRMGIAGSVASIANRVSYALNLHGPSITVDTMCSSSLTAIHLACQDLQQGRISLALAGGVNLNIHPSKYLMLSAVQALSGEGHCQAFGERGDGYVPADGVGVVVLKRLSEAQRDGDHIYGIIRGTALNHGGKTNGYTVPNPQAQAGAISRALREAGVDARHISYIEAHGTGTKLGDPIEIAGLSKAFGEYTEEKGYCWIGSVKSNIGHCESAAGIAGLTKVLLQMEYEEIVPSLHAQELNPHIDFGKSPFVVNRELRRWERPEINGMRVPRIAGISSFGAGGSNAHIIVEEYDAPVPAADSRPAAIVLSARTATQLRQKVVDLIEFIRARQNNINLVSLSYTLQVGREAMEERLALEAGSVEQLLEKLETYARGEKEIEGVYEGEVKRNQEALALFRGDPELQQTVERWLAIGKFAKVLDLWVKGWELDWTKLYGQMKPQRMSLPTYPFARERYWIPDTATAIETKGDLGMAVSSGAIHPMVHRNTSDFTEQRFSSTFNGEEFFLSDHVVNGERVLPGVAYLEMVRAGIEAAGRKKNVVPVGLKLKDVIWVQPVKAAGEPVELHIGLRPAENGEIEYEIYREGANQTESGEEEDQGRVIHSQGRAVLVDSREQAQVDIQKLQTACKQRVLTGAECYEAFKAAGLDYGPAFRGIEAIHIGVNGAPHPQALAKLKMPVCVADGQSGYVLHPSMMDAALQASLALISAGKNGVHGQMVLQACLPFSLEQIDITAQCPEKGWAWLRWSEGSNSEKEKQKFDIDLCDEQGKVCVGLRGLTARALKKENEQEPQVGNVMFAPVWDAAVIEQRSLSYALTEKLLILGGTEAHHQLVRQRCPTAHVLSLGARDTIEVIAQQLEAQGPFDHLLWIVPDSTATSVTDEEFIEGQEHGVLFCFRLIKALLQSGYGSRKLRWTVITTATQAIHQHDVSQPVHASVHGLIGSLAKEYTSWKIRLVDVEAKNEWPFDQILMLDGDPQGDAWVYRKGGWYRPKLVRCELPAVADGPYRTGGVYVVIGGAGGVGEVFSEHLIRKYQAQIIWIGRRAIDEQITGKQERLSRLGPMPEYIQADAGSYEQLQHAYEQIRQRHGAVHGVVHSALQLLDKSLWQMDEERFKRALTGKVDTTVRMAQVFGKDKLDFVIFFSSLQSFSKAAGQSNYAAGCTFVDAYSHELRRQWKCPVKVINWGFWGEVGVVATREYRERMAQAGLGSIEPKEGMLALEQLLFSPVGQAAFVKVTRTDAIAKVEMREPMQIAVHDAPSVLEELETAKLMEVPQELINQRRRTEALEKLLGKLLFGQMNSLGAFAELSIEQWRQKIGIPKLYWGWIDESIRKLEELGYIGRAEDGWHVNESVAIDMQTAVSEWERWKEEAREGALKAQIRLLDATLGSLPEVLRGRRLATEVLFPNSSMDLVEEIYKNNEVPDYFNEKLAGLVAGYVQERVRRDQGVKLRILEIGAGTGGSSAAIFRMLAGLKDHIEEYAYTDVSRAFLLHAEQKYGEKLRYLKCRLLDVEQPVSDQSVDVGSYDLVLAGNVLHATRNIRQTVRNLKAALKRHGIMLLNELATNTLFLHLTFGLTEGWWRFEDAELRLPGCPALPEDRWRQVLEEEGFAPVLFPAAQGKMLGQQIIAAESDGVIRKCDMRSAASQCPAESAGLLQSKPVAAQPKTVEHANEMHARGTQKTQALSAQMIERHVRSMIRESIAEVLKIEESRVQDDHSFSDYGVDSIIAVKVVNRMSQQCGVILPVTIVFDHNNVEQLVRYMTKEHHASLVAMLQATETPAEKTDGSPEKNEAGERATPTVAPLSSRVPGRWRKEAAAAPVVAAHSSNGVAATGEGIYHRVVVERPGDINDVKWIEAIVPSLREHEVRIAVKAFSLNFGDLLCVRGLYPNMPAFPFTPGFEVSGTVVSVGQGVNSVKVGQEVIALTGDTMGGQATVLTCSEQQVFPKLDALSFEEACSLPAVGITMIDAFRKAELQPGEKILIQTAAGGTGLIAVQLAQHAGAEVYATAGTPQKLEYLRKLGIKHTINYREMDFEQEIKRITGGAGIDVVINTLSGDAIQKGLNCLSEAGRYIEIAMTALKSAKNVDLSVLSNNQAFYSVDISRLARKNPALISEYYRELMALVEQGVVRPTINEVVEFPRVQDAYRYLENRDNIGKVVVTIPEAYQYRESGMKATVAEAATVQNFRTLSREPIAIIGMSGKFGAADSVDKLWEYLSQGKDLTQEVSRWPLSPEAAKFCPRGSFVHGIDQFDPLFFKISGVEAAYMDPQQRLFLEETWKALENAGYAGGVLEGRQCGVYVGCASGDYAQLFQGKVPSQAYWGNAGSVIPARIAYYLDLQGPAVAVDTACSSSLVAIHLASQALWAGEVEMAIAGGVFLQCTPRFYISSGNAGMLSPTGRCYTFDERADGFVPGEGVGVIVLKRLRDALAQGDHIYGVVRGSGINQDGTTNGITAPSAASQERLERHVYESFHIHPEEIQMVEAHGTGTKLGDPVEYQALTRSFRKSTEKKNYCAIGSIKTNIGHAAMAAGIAGVIKVLLSLQHKQIPPSLNYERGNSHIDFSESPFYVNTTLKDWMVGKNSRRCAVVSSFGFSGTNAHIVIEEAPKVERRHRERPGHLIVLSGRTEEQLRQQVKQLVQHIERTPVEDCGDISYTLLVGRKHWNHRLTCIVRSSAELLSMLKRWLEKGDASQVSVFQVQENDRREKISLKDYGHRCITECRNGIDPVSYLERLAAIGELFGHGYNLPFEQIFAGGNYRRISLPTYPFARERHWVQIKGKDESAASSIQAAGGIVQLHPLLHENTSDLIEQSYRTLFHGQEFFLTDHMVQGAKVLPGVIYLEMARAAIEQAAPSRPEPGILELRNVVWLKPVVVTGPQQVNIALFMNEDEQIDFEIYTTEDEQRTLHFQGEAIFSHHSNPARLDAEQLARQMKKGVLEPSYIYSWFADIGLSYGPAHQGINAIFQGEKQILARLHLPAIVETNHHEYVLHPSLMDAALQASIGLIADGNHQCISMPFALESLRIISACTKEMIAWMRYSQKSNAKLDIDLCDDQGNICVEIRGFTSRVLETDLKSTHQKTANGFHPNGKSHNGFHKDSVFNDDFYQKVITDVVNGDVSIDEAVKLG